MLAPHYYGHQFKLQYLWDQLIKKLTYLAVANSWGELNGRPRPPSMPPLGTSMPASTMPGFIAVSSTVACIYPLFATMEEAVIIAKTEEEATVI